MLRVVAIVLSTNLRALNGFREHLLSSHIHLSMMVGIGDFHAKAPAASHKSFALHCGHDYMPDTLACCNIASAVDTVPVADIGPVGDTVLAVGAA